MCGLWPRSWVWEYLFYLSIYLQHSAIYNIKCTYKLIYSRSLATESTDNIQVRVRMLVLVQQEQEQEQEQEEKLELELEPTAPEL